MMKCEMMIKIMNIETDGEYEGGMEAKSGVKWRRKMVKWRRNGGEKWCKMETKNGEMEVEWRRKVTGLYSIYNIVCIKFSFFWGWDLEWDLALWKLGFSHFQQYGWQI